MDATTIGVEEATYDERGGDAGSVARAESPLDANVAGPLDAQPAMDANQNWPAMPDGVEDASAGGDARTNAPSRPPVWELIARGAHDVAVASDGTVWIVGPIPDEYGYSVHKWNEEEGWESANGSAERIAVEPDGVPWVVNNKGWIYRGTSNDAAMTAWTMFPGCAKDIAIGPGVEVWIVGCNPVMGGFEVEKWSGAEWDGAVVGGTRISVGPGGVPWIVNDVGEIYRRISTDLTTEGWELVPAAGPAHDVAVAPRGAVYITAWDEMDGGFGLRRLDGDRWISVVPSGAGINVAANDRVIWLANDYPAVYRLAL